MSWTALGVLALVLVTSASMRYRTSAQATQGIVLRQQANVELLLSADKRVVDLTQAGDNIRFTVQLLRDGQPLANYKVYPVVGSQLFPDAGEVSVEEITTNTNGEGTFTYRPAEGAREDIIDISAVAYVNRAKIVATPATLAYDNISNLFTAFAQEDNSETPPDNSETPPADDSDTPTDDTTPPDATDTPPADDTTPPDADTPPAENAVDAPATDTPSDSSSGDAGGLFSGFIDAFKSAFGIKTPEPPPPPSYSGSAFYTDTKGQQWMDTGLGRTERGFRQGRDSYYDYHLQDSQWAGSPIPKILSSGVFDERNDIVELTSPKTGNILVRVDGILKRLDRWANHPDTDPREAAAVSLGVQLWLDEISANSSAPEVQPDLGDGAIAPDSEVASGTLQIAADDPEDTSNATVDKFVEEANKAAELLDKANQARAEAGDSDQPTSAGGVTLEIGEVKEFSDGSGGTIKYLIDSSQVPAQIRNQYHLIISCEPAVCDLGRGEGSVDKSLTSFGSSRINTTQTVKWVGDTFQRAITIKFNVVRFEGVGSNETRQNVLSQQTTLQQTGPTFEEQQQNEKDSAEATKEGGDTLEGDVPNPYEDNSGATINVSGKQPTMTISSSTPEGADPTLLSFAVSIKIQASYSGSGPATGGDSTSLLPAWLRANTAYAAQIAQFNNVIDPPTNNNVFPPMPPGGEDDPPTNNSIFPPFNNNSVTPPSGGSDPGSGLGADTDVPDLVFLSVTDDGVGGSFRPSLPSTVEGTPGSYVVSYTPPSLAVSQGKTVRLSFTARDKKTGLEITEDYYLHTTKPDPNESARWTHKIDMYMGNAENGLYPARNFGYIPGKSQSTTFTPMFLGSLTGFTMLPYTSPGSPTRNNSIADIPKAKELGRLDDSNLGIISFTLVDGKNQPIAGAEVLVYVKTAGPPENTGLVAHTSPETDQSRQSSQQNPSIFNSKIKTITDPNGNVAGVNVILGHRNVKTDIEVCATNSFTDRLGASQATEVCKTIENLNKHRIAAASGGSGGGSGTGGSSGSGSGSGSGSSGGSDSGGANVKNSDGVQISLKPSYWQQPSWGKGTVSVRIPYTASVNYTEKAAVGKGSITASATNLLKIVGTSSTSVDVPKGGGKASLNFTVEVQDRNAEGSISVVAKDGGGGQASISLTAGKAQPDEGTSVGGSLRLVATPNNLNFAEEARIELQINAFADAVIENDLKVNCSGTNGVRLETNSSKQTELKATKVSDKEYGISKQLYYLAFFDNINNKANIPKATVSCSTSATEYTDLLKTNKRSLSAKLDIRSTSPANSGSDDKTSIAEIRGIEPESYLYHDSYYGRPQIVKVSYFVGSQDVTIGDARLVIRSKDGWRIDEGRNFNKDGVGNDFISKGIAANGQEGTYSFSLASPADKDAAKASSVTLELTVTSKNNGQQVKSSRLLQIKVQQTTPGNNDTGAKYSEFEFDPSVAPQGTNMDAATSDAQSRLNSLSFISKAQKDKINQELAWMAQYPDYREKGMSNVSSIVRQASRGTSGNSSNYLNSSDPDYVEAMDALGDLSFDVYADTMYRKDTVSDRTKTMIEQAAPYVKAGNWNALDAVIDNTGQWLDPETARRFYQSAGDYTDTGFSGSGQRLPRDPQTGKPIQQSNTSGGNQSGSSGSGVPSQGVTSMLSFDLLDVGGALANTGATIASGTINLWSNFVNWISSIFY